MIDFHTHILPMMDDGSQSVEESLAMLKMEQEQGVDTVVVTPHFDMRKESIEEFLARRDMALKKIPLEEIPGMRLIPGTELLYSDVPLRRYENLEALCIGGRYLLIETLYPEWNETFQKDLQCLILERNIVPILAHIERYYWVGKNRKVLRTLREDGALLQMNAEFFLHHQTFRKAIRLFQKEKVHLLGSDSHRIDFRTPNLGNAIQKIQEWIGNDTIEGILLNGERVLEICQ